MTTHLCYSSLFLLCKEVQGGGREVRNENFCISSTNTNNKYVAKLIQSWESPIQIKDSESIYTSIDPVHATRNY